VDCQARNRSRWPYEAEADRGGRGQVCRDLERPIPIARPARAAPDRRGQDQRRSRLSPFQGGNSGHGVHRRHRAPPGATGRPATPPSQRRRRDAICATARWPVTSCRSHLAPEHAIWCSAQPSRAGRSARQGALHRTCRSMIQLGRRRDQVRADRVTCWRCGYKTIRWMRRGCPAADRGECVPETVPEVPDVGERGR
jgi:hypothetical protein